MTQKEKSLISRFGTTDILEILGPAGTIPPTQSLSSRLQEFGFTSKSYSKWVNTFLPTELLDSLKPYQKSLGLNKRFETNVRRFGGRSPFASSLVRSKREQTFQEKFGGNPAKNAVILEKIKQTNNLRYNGPSPFSDEAVRAKVAATNISRYGGASPSCDPFVRAKQLDTMLRKYGHFYPRYISLEELSHRLANYSLELADDLDISHGIPEYFKVRCTECGTEFTTHHIRSNSRGYRGHGFTVCPCQFNASRLQKHISEYITSFGYSCEQIQPDWIPSPTGKQGRNLEIDCFIKELNIGFEINGYWSHNSTIGPHGSDPKDPSFHRYKSECALSHGVKLYHIWHYAFTPEDRFLAERVVDMALDPYFIPELDDDGTISRDILPDPSVVGFPYIDLGPQPFEAISDKQVVTCYTSGSWKFLL